jgi:hypothetical protein
MNEHEFLNWLLESPTPTIRYLTLRHLLGQSAEDPQVRQAQDAIMTEGPAPAILAAQTPTGQWSSQRSYYTPKYRSTHWSMMLLTELHADGRDPRFQRGVDYMLDATAEAMRKNLDTRAQGWSCLWGNILRYALHAGRSDDPRVKAIVQYTLHDIREGHCQCRYNDGYACAWGVVRTLWGLAAIPAAERDADMKAVIQQGLAFLLDDNRLIAANYPTPDNGKVSTLWGKLNFPLFYQVDTLFTLRILAALDALDHPGAQAALDWLGARRGRDGRWQGRSPYRQHTWATLGDHTETQRWVSLHAALILQQAGRLPRFSQAARPLAQDWR